MAITDSFASQLANAAVNQVGATMTQTRSDVNSRLTQYVTGMIPNINRIPGAFGSIVQRQVNNMVGDGVGQIFNAVGIPINTAARELHTKIFNNGVDAAKQIWSDQRSGVTNVGQIVSRAQEPLTLLRYTHDNLMPRAADNTPQLGQRYSPYAMDLFRLAPKHKFLFVVDFVFNGGYEMMGRGKGLQNEFAMVIHEFDRPTIKYEYEDDVNYYNFRTKIPKKVIHEPLAIRFLDDRQNLSMQFFNQYLKATHPISAMGVESAAFYEENGMNFTGGALNASSTGILQNNNRTILKEIKVYHIYDFGAMMNTYHFTNPKITSIDLDAWTMEASDGNTINAQFAYDAMHLELATPINTAENAKIGRLSNAGRYPMTPLQIEQQEYSQPMVPVQMDSRGVSVGSVAQPVVEVRKLSEEKYISDARTLETLRRETTIN